MRQKNDKYIESHYLITNYFIMNVEHYHIQMQDIMTIEVKLADKSEVQSLAKQFQYDQSKSMNQNLKYLSQMVISFLGVSGKTSETLSNYLVQKNIPIQVNFKPLKFQQLVSILEQWLSMYTESSTILQKLYTNKHRNIHFRRILFDQQQTINDYFQTLSDKKMLKAVNLYQLLVQILSNSYIYEYRADSQTFFQKVNSFNTFVDIVKKFVHSQKRISLVSNKEDFEYIQRIEFQRLIQFWEQQNNELQLLPQRRINKTEISVQTNLINVKESETQTLNCSSLTEFINGALFTLNKLTLIANNVKQLTSIERIYSSLRKQKLFLLSQTEDYTLKFPIYSHSQYKINEITLNCQNLIGNHSKMFDDHSQTLQKVALRETLIDRLKQTNQIAFSRTISPNRKLNSAVEAIYNFYQQIEGFSIIILEKCLFDLGVIDCYNSPLITSLLKKKLIVNKQHVSEEQFKRIVRYLMQNDKQLTIEVLEDFITYRRTLGVKINTPKAGYSLFSPVTKSTSFFLNNKQRNYMGKYIE